MLSKSDYVDDADSFSFMYGIGGYFSVGKEILLVMVILTQIQKEIIILLIQQQMKQIQLVTVILLAMILSLIN